MSTTTHETGANPTKHETVTVTFNGPDKLIEYNPHEAVQAMLQAAKIAFNAQGNHLLGLFTEGGTELPDNESVQDAGVRPRQLLILRQSAVRGGA